MKFSEFKQELIAEASIRQGLPHITTMDHHQFGALIKTGKVHLDHMTEKTDGMTHKAGHDEHGFYTQSSGSGSEKMRSAEDFEHRARRRAKETGKPLDLTAAKAFGHVHSMMAKDKELQAHLKQEHKRTGQDTSIRGEVFYKPLSKPGHHPGEVKFVATSYDPKHMGEHGKYVVHTKLPDNKHLTKHFGTHEMNWDTDHIEHQGGHVDVSDEHHKFMALNHTLMSSRTTPSNKAAKLAELEKLDKIKHSVSKKVDAHIKSQKLRPKWGSGSEGIVVHPSDHNPHAPRFKVTSDAFRAYRAAPSTFKK
jgi:hypothetical protein